MNSHDHKGRSKQQQRHAPQIDHSATRIVGCTCGWLTPPGTTDSDHAYVAHATVMR